MLLAKAPTQARSLARTSMAHMVRVAATVLFVGATLGGCAFKPLYATNDAGQSTRSELAAVEILTIPGRVGQVVRNELLFKQTGGGSAELPKYRLEVALRERVVAQLVEKSGDARAENYELTADFTLINIADDKVMLKSRSASRAAYERFSRVEPDTKQKNIYGNIRARLDAENRAARTIAEDISTRLAAFLSSGV